MIVSSFAKSCCLYIADTTVADTIAPVVVSIDRLSPKQSPSPAATATFQIQFSELVGGLSTAAGKWLLTGVGSSVQSVAAVAPDAQGRAYAYTVVLAVDDGIAASINLAVGAVSDAAGNSNTPSAAVAGQYERDSTLPRVVSLQRTIPSSSPASADRVLFQADFSERVLVSSFTADAGNFVLTGAAASSALVLSVAAQNADAAGQLATSFVVTVSLSGTGVLTLGVAAGAASDLAGNLNAASSMTASYTRGA